MPKLRRRRIKLFLRGLRDYVHATSRNHRVTPMDVPDGADAPLHPESMLLITLDSLRVDTFQNADAPALKAAGRWLSATTPATFTYAAHQAIWVGVTPVVPESRKPFLNPKAGRIFRLINSAAGGTRNDYVQLLGANIIEGYRNKGYRTIGVGAMRWFDPSLPSGLALTKDFDAYKYTGVDVAAQVDFVMQEIRASAGKPLFIFVNVGETHIPYHYKGAPWVAKNFCVPLGSNNNREICQERQRKCLEYADAQLRPLLDLFSDAAASMVICSDHGDCHGEDGLWGHGFAHEQVMRVPMMLRLRPRHRDDEDINTANEGEGVDLSAVETVDPELLTQPALN